jgi:AAA domain-containing protein
VPANSKGEWRPWEPGDPVIVLPYGRFRVGKTFGAGTFPRPCILDYDRGLGSLYAPDFMKKYGVRKFLHRSFWETTFDGPVVKAHNAYDDSCRYFDYMMEATRRDTFDTWVIDSGTTLSEYAQNKGAILMGTQEYGFRSHSHELAIKYKLAVPVIQDYGAERSLVEQFVDMVLSVGKHFVFICHEKELKDKEGNLLAIAPLLTGQSVEAIPLRFDEVYNIQLMKGVTHFNKETHVVTQDWMRVCKTSPDGLVRAGSRNGVPDGIEWNYESVLKALTANYHERLRLIAAAQAEADKAASSSAASPPAAA